MHPDLNVIRWFEADWAKLAGLAIIVAGLIAAYLGKTALEAWRLDRKSLRDYDLAVRRLQSQSERRLSRAKGPAKKG